MSFSFYPPKPENDGKRVQDFFLSMEDAIRDHPLWANATEEDIDCAMEVHLQNVNYISFLSHTLCLLAFCASFCKPKNRHIWASLSSDRMSLIWHIHLIFYVFSAGLREICID